MRAPWLSFGQKLVCLGHFSLYFLLLVVLRFTLFTLNAFYGLIVSSGFIIGASLFSRFNGLTFDIFSGGSFTFCGFYLFIIALQEPCVSSADSSEGKQGQDPS